MSLMNSGQGYGLVTRFNHWATAVVFITLIPMGMILEEMDDTRSEVFFQLIGLHKSLAVVLMGLVLLRLVWMLVDRVPVVAEPAADWQRMLSKVVRLVLWAGLIGMPLSGWIMSNSAGYPVSLFGLFDLPRLVGESYQLHEIAEEVHEALPPLLILAFLLHVAGALKHHLVDGDRTMKRMLGGTVTSR